MSTFFKDGYEKLDEKISSLKNEINSLQYSLWDPHVAESWQAIEELTKEIKEKFKTVRYPTKQDRDEAWQQFFELMQGIYVKKNKRFVYVSANHKNTLFEKMRGLEYWRLSEGLRQMFFNDLNEIKAEVIEKQRKIKEVGQHFSSVKNEMTGDDKFEVFNRIKEIRKSHDEFFEQYKERGQELIVLREEKRRNQEEYQERKEKAKHSLIENIKNNRKKLEKAEDALSKQESHRDDLEEKIESAYSDSYRERHKGWLRECNEKIKDIERYIDKLKDWIEDGENKLRNWS